MKHLSVLSSSAKTILSDLEKIFGPKREVQRKLWIPSLSSKTMAECAPGNDSSKADVLDSSGASAESAPVAAFKCRPTDLGLIRSLSKSDSDLLASPHAEEDGGLAGRTGSVSNCRSGQPSSAERMPSFASEWDEVILTLWGRGGTSGRAQRTEEGGAAQGFQEGQRSFLERASERASASKVPIGPSVAKGAAIRNGGLMREKGRGKERKPSVYFREWDRK